MAQESTRVLNLVRKESPMYPPSKGNRKAVPMKLVTMLAATAVG